MGTAAAAKVARLRVMMERENFIVRRRGDEAVDEELENGDGNVGEFRRGDGLYPLFGQAQA